jgi:hypothetical protein
MNRSSSKAREANAPGLWKRARQLLRAFADAGQQSVTGLRLFVGPNGILASPEASQVDGSEPYVISVLAVPERSAAPVDRQSTVTTPLVEPTGSCRSRLLPTASRQESHDQYDLTVTHSRALLDCRRSFWRT